MTDELSIQIMQACVDNGVSPGIFQLAPEGGSLVSQLPPNCPIPEMCIYDSFYESVTPAYHLTVMLEQQVGSQNYWIPVSIWGPGAQRDYSDETSPKGWSIVEALSLESNAYEDLEKLSNGWWPTLEEAWAAIPGHYKYYDADWRRQSECVTCFCTGVYIWGSIRLPCPECRTTPQLVYGFQGLKWVPAHTKERRPHAKKGKKWRWRYGEGYIVEYVLEPNVEDGSLPGDDYCFVGLKRHEAVDNPDWVYGDNIKVGPEWADFDLEPPEPEVALSVLSPRRWWRPSLSQP